MKSAFRSSFVFLLVLLVAALPAAARGKKVGPTTPGRYSDWQGEIDELEIVEPFHVADYDRIVVEPFDASATPLPDKDDNTYEPVQRMLGRAHVPFASALRQELRGGPEVVALDRDEKAGTAPKTLVVRGKVLTMDPGSRAARYWAGFGAGAARTEISGEIADAATGKVLLRFQQERRSGVGAAGGGYEELLERNLETIGEDAARILKAF